jgi:hypothetical protein
MDLDAPDSQQPLGVLDLPDEPFPLEIGAGERPTPGFIHNDARPLPDIEVVSDAREELVSLVGPGRVTVLRACHVLEHFPYAETVNILRLWRSLLIPGGFVHLEVPNMTWQIQACARGEITDSEFVYYAYGEQNYSGNFHCAGFSPGILTSSLEQSGFEGININDIGQVLVANANNPL